MAAAKRRAKGSKGPAEADAAEPTQEASERQPRHTHRVSVSFAVPQKGYPEGRIVPARDLDHALELFGYAKAPGALPRASYITRDVWKAGRWYAVEYAFAPDWPHM